MDRSQAGEKGGVERGKVFRGERGAAPEVSFSS